MIKERRVLQTIRLIGFIAMVLMHSLPGCRVIRGITDPALRLYKRGSCISIDVPPITLTPSQTSLERQLIGDDVSLEENGWLVASAKSSKNTASSDANLSDARDLYREIGVLEYLAEDMDKYKQIGFIGESYDGHLYILPKNYLSQAALSVDQDEMRKAIFIIGEINQSRENILKFYIKRESEKDGRNLDSINTKYKYIYYNQVKQGEWRQLKDGKWERVK